MWTLVAQDRSRPPRDVNFTAAQAGTFGSTGWEEPRWILRRADARQLDVTE
jgi:hypothetical protein